MVSGDAISPPNPGIVGTTIEVNNYPLTVVGVTDPKFHGTTVSYDVEVFIPIMMAGQILKDFSASPATASTFLSDRRASVLFPHGFLRRGATAAQAAAQLDAAWATLSRDRPLTEVIQRLRVVPFLEWPGTAPAIMLPTLLVMTAMGLLLLLIACANVAGLVLVRGLSRRGELAIRLALGATRTRIVRLLIIENLVLAIPGSMLGVVLARRGIPVLVEYAELLAAPQRLFFNIELDSLVLAYAVIVASGCALAFGFVPALQSSRIDLVTIINEDASPRGAARGRFRAALVVAQVAVSLVLLVAASLTTRSVDAAKSADPGFDGSHMATLGVDVKQNGYDEARGHRFYQGLLESVRRDAGVESAALAQFEPLAFLETRRQRVALDGNEPRRGEDVALMFNTISPDYFRTLRVNMIAGRPFEDHDDERGAPVAIVNKTFAQKFWGGASNALGKRLKAGDGDWRTVVGVAADIKYLRINEPAMRVLLPAASAGVPIRDDSLRAGKRAGRAARRAGASARRDARSGPADHVLEAVRSPRRARPVRVHGGDAVRVRRGRDGACGHGHLRARVVYGQAEYARDRDSDGARRVSAISGPRVSRAWAAARRRRRCLRRARGAQSEPCAAERAVRCQRDGRRFAGAGARDCHRRRRAGDDCAGLARCTHEPAQRAAPPIDGAR